MATTGMMFSSLLGHLGKGRLKALEQRVGVLVLGNVPQQLFGQIRQSAMAYFSGGEARAHHLCGRGACHGEDTALHVWSAQVTVYIRHSRLVVGAGGGIGRSHELRGSGRHFAAEGFNAGSRDDRGILVTTEVVMIGTISSFRGHAGVRCPAEGLLRKKRRKRFKGRDNRRRVCRFAGLAAVSSSVSDVGRVL